MLVPYSTGVNTPCFSGTSKPAQVSLHGISSSHGGVCMDFSHDGMWPFLIESVFLFKIFWAQSVLWAESSGIKWCLHLNVLKVLVLNIT